MKQLIVPRTKIQENFKPALCGAIQNGSFQSHHKTKILAGAHLVRPLLSSFCH